MRWIEILEDNAGGKRPLGPNKHKQNNSIKMYHTNIWYGGVNWIHVTPGGEQWEVVVNTAINIRGQWKAWNFFRLRAFQDSALWTGIPDAHIHVYVATCMLMWRPLGATTRLHAATHFSCLSPSPDLSCGGHPHSIWHTQHSKDILITGRPM